ncbi:unnamed protein product, partial [Urochloa humidicola]
FRPRPDPCLERTDEATSQQAWKLELIVPGTASTTAGRFGGVDDGDAALLPPLAVLFVGYLFSPRCRSTKMSLGGG